MSERPSPEQVDAALEAVSLGSTAYGPMLAAEVVALRAERDELRTERAERFTWNPGDLVRGVDTESTYRTQDEWQTELARERTAREAAERERDVANGRADVIREGMQRQQRATEGRAERAEAEAARLRDALERVEDDARRGKIASESVRVDQDWPVHDTIHRFSVIRSKARSALAPFPRRST